MTKKFLPILFILALIACCIEVDISVPGFPLMAQDLAVSEAIIQLTIALNFLGFFLSSIFYGPLCESIGRRHTMVIGNAILAIGAIGCVLSPSIEWLLVSRFIQGLGASTSAVVVFVMISDMYEGRQAVRLIGVMNSLLTTLMAIAPIIGACINEVVGWRGSYGIVAAISLLSWVLLYLILPETKNVRVPFNFLHIARNYKKLLSTSSFIYSSLVPSIFYAMYLCFIACAPFLYMETYGFSMRAYATHQALIVGAFSVFSIISGYIISRIGSYRSARIGITLSGVATILFAFVSLISPMSAYLVTSTMMLLSIGNAISYPVIFTASLEVFPEMKGTASSAVMGMRSLVCSLLVAAAGYLYNGNPFTLAVTMLFAASIAVTLALLIFQVHLIPRYQPQELK